MLLTLATDDGPVSLTLIEMSSLHTGDVRVRVLVDRRAWERITAAGLFLRDAAPSAVVPLDDGSFPLRAVLHGRPASAVELLGSLEAGDATPLLGLRLVEALTAAPADVTDERWEDVLLPVGDDVVDAVTTAERLGFRLLEADRLPCHALLGDADGLLLRVGQDAPAGGFAELRIDVGQVRSTRAEVLEFLNLINIVLPVGAISLAVDGTILLRATAMPAEPDHPCDLAEIAAALVGQGRHLAGPLRSVASARLGAAAAWRVVGA